MSFQERVEKLSILKTRIDNMDKTLATFPAISSGLDHKIFWRYETYLIQRKRMQEEYHKTNKQLGDKVLQEIAATLVSMASKPTHSKYF